MKESWRGPGSSAGGVGNGVIGSRFVVGFGSDFGAGDGEDEEVPFRRLLSRAERSSSGVDGLGDMGLGLVREVQHVM